MKRSLAVVLMFSVAACNQGRDASSSTPEQAGGPSGAAPGTKEWKIENAMSAAPAAIAKDATIMEWPATPGGAPVELRAGSNGWTCFSDTPETPGNDPMCVDKGFSAWATAWMSRTKPEIKEVGFAYMLQGGSDASNTDPFTMKPAPGESWIDTGPHVMMVVPNPAALAGISTDHHSGGPYVMWQGTPYAHVMMPVK